MNETFTGVIPANSVFSGAKWISSSDNATVTSAGVVTAKKTGACVITGYYTTPYEAPAIKYTLNILPAVPAVQEESKTIKVDETFTGQLPATAGFSGVKWISSAPTNASVVEGTGVVTGKAVGTAIITGSYTKPYETPIKKYNLTVNAKE